MTIAAKIASRELNRRSVITTGTGALAALAGFDGVRIVRAQGTPEAMPAGSLKGMFGIARSYVVKDDASADELIAIVETFVPIVSGTPGFIRYNVIYDETSRGFISVGMFDNAESSEASSEEAAQHRADNNTDAYFVDPEPVVVQGEIVISAVAAAEGTPEAAASLTGMFGVTRSYDLKDDANVDELIAIVEGFVAIVAADPGFIAYHVIIDEASRGLITIGFFENQESSEASSEQSAQYIADNDVGRFYKDPQPVIVQGAIVISST